jgi:polyisoprenyl-phosphate glycosyltransferase
MPHLSVVSSIYNTGDVLQDLVREILEAVVVITADYEVVLVDDGSPDGAWSLLEALCAGNSRIKAVKLTRNFGQHRALAAGLDVCSGEYVVVMDSDLQDQPKEIWKLYEKAKEGYPVVTAKRGARMDGWRRRFYSRVFYWLLWKLSGLKTDHSIGNFAIYHRTVIEEVKRMQEADRYLPIIITWAGWRRATVTVAHEGRKMGDSGYSVAKLLRLAFSITLSYSDKPLRYAVKAGFVISCISLVFGGYTLVQYLRGKILVLGYTSIILSIWFMGGVILFTLGMAGVYVGRTFEETKRRPRYVIERSIN